MRRQKIASGMVQKASRGLPRLINVVSVPFKIKPDPPSNSIKRKLAKPRIRKRRSPKRPEGRPAARIRRAHIKPGAIAKSVS